MSTAIKRDPVRLPNAIDVHVGKRVRELRTMAGISQTDLGDLLGITFQQIQKYESGANRVSASRLWNMSEKLGIPITAFFEGLNGVPAIENDIRTTRLTLDIVRNLGKCTPTMREAIAKIVKVAAEEQDDV